MTIKELGEKCSERVNSNCHPCSGCPYTKECGKCRSELPFILTHQIPSILEKLSINLSDDAE